LIGEPSPNENKGCVYIPGQLWRSYTQWITADCDEVEKYICKKTGKTTIMLNFMSIP